MNKCFSSSFIGSVILWFVINMAFVYITHTVPSIGKTSNTRVETPKPENWEKQSNNNRRRKQEKPQRSGSYNLEVCTQCTCGRRAARVHRSTQTSPTEAQWRSELRECVSAPRVPGGVSITLLDDSQDRLLKVSREGLMMERQRKSVIRRNLWQKLAGKWLFICFQASRDICDLKII